MTLREALKAIGTDRKTDLAKALGISKQAINKWAMDGPIPELREKQIKYEILPALKKKFEAA